MIGGIMFVVCLLAAAKHGWDGDLPMIVAALPLLTTVGVGVGWLMRKLEVLAIRESDRPAAPTTSTPVAGPRECLRCYGTGIDQANGGNCPACGKRGWD